MKRRLIAVVVLGLGAFLMGVPAEAQANPRTLNVVALGDSYASGVGAGDYDPATVGNCYRSANSYSELYVAALRTAGTQVKFTNVTCSGANTDTVRQGQLSALTGSTDLVLLSVGGNDAHFSTYAGVCVLDDCSGWPTRFFLLQLPVVSERVQALLRAIGQAAPRARIVLVGYGQPMTTNQTSPSPVDPICERFTAQERQATGVAAGSLDSALLASVLAARRQGVAASYVSPYAVPFVLRQTFVGHSLCERAPWYHGFDSGEFATFHPTGEWQAAVAGLLQTRLPVS